MTSRAVEWVLVVRYLLSHHKATYGRLNNKQYTKDYIQLSQDSSFMDDIAAMFSKHGKAKRAVPLIYKWPGGTTPGKLIFRSTDRPHLSWETRLGAPAVWKMATAPNGESVETIPGNPSHKDPAKADNEFKLLGSRGAGQPYLVAVKLHGEDGILHLRTYLDGASSEFGWADVGLLPSAVRQLVTKTSRNSALAWARTDSAAGVVYFDPSRNHDAWRPAGGLAQGGPTKTSPETSSGDVGSLDVTDSAIAAEALEVSAPLVEEFKQKIEDQDFEVGDVYSTSKTRGSAQRAFSQKVKSNYGWTCAITGISTRHFLVAAHIVPWSQDKNIRLDPTNGICLSVLLDRAFEEGYIIINDDLCVVVDKEKIAGDAILADALGQYDGQSLRMPKRDHPRVDYLRRRRGADPTAAPS